MPDEKIERIRSLLAHTQEQEIGNPSPVLDSSRMSYVASADEIERLRSLFAHAHDPERTNPFRRLVFTDGRAIHSSGGAAPTAWNEQRRHLTARTAQEPDITPRS